MFPSTNPFFPASGAKAWVAVPSPANETIHGPGPDRMAWDGMCREDRRFAASAAAVRRLGGASLAAVLVEAVRAGAGGHAPDVQGSMCVSGVLFDYCLSEKGVLISNAEVVWPDPTLPAALTMFFRNVWLQRARHATRTAAGFIGQDRAAVA